jgi:hypothetical protein
MKSPAVVLFLVAAAYAQTNPLIPSGISTPCSTFMGKLDSDPQILSCTKAFTSAAANFGVGSNSGNASSSAVTSALNTLCPSLSACPDSVIRSQLADFYAACPNELTSSPNNDVIRAYDVLYALLPLSKAVCTKSDSGAYCVLEVGSTNSTGKNLLASDSTGSSPADGLWLALTSKNSRRGEEQVIIPNLEQFKSTNLVFLGIQPSLAAEQLCRPCTRNVLNEYIQFTSSLPYAPGIANSPLMSGEPDLYKAVQEKCGAPFLSGSVQAAGGISGNILGGGAATLSVDTRAVAGALSAIVVGFFVAL